MKVLRRWAAALPLLLLLLLPPVQAGDSASGIVLVHAAASLSNVMQQLGASYQQQSGQQVQFSFAASSTLARQIEAGAPADVFISADGDWMDYLQSRGLINTGTRSDLLGNRLVLIAPADSTSQLKIAPGFGLAAALAGGRLSMGDPDSVPAGKYGRAALLALGVWNEVADRVVRGDSVRTALAFVERGEAPLGIVYETDSLSDRKVRVIDRFPASSHPPIVYPVALTTTARPGAAQFLAWLRTPTAQAAFVKAGFITLP